MLVSFNPSLITPSVNKKTPNRTSFQKLTLPQDLIRHTQSATDAERLATRFKTEKLKITQAQVEQMIELAEGGAKGVLRDLSQRFKGINIIPT